MLNPEQDSCEFGKTRIGCDRRARGADERVEFVDRSVGRNARAVLGDALSAGEGRLSPVSLARIDAVDGHARFIERLAHSVTHFKPATKSPEAKHWPYHRTSRAN